MIRAITLLLLLAGCAQAGNAPDAVCDREANNDPVVKDIIMKQAGVSWLAFSYPNALENARDRAKRACLARIGGLPAGGGVEPVGRPESSFKGLF